MQRDLEIQLGFTRYAEMRVSTLETQREAQAERLARLEGQRCHYTQTVTQLRATVAALMQAGARPGRIQESLDKVKAADAAQREVERLLVQEREQLGALEVALQHEAGERAEAWALLSARQEEMERGNKNTTSPSLSSASSMPAWARDRVYAAEVR